MAEKTDISDPVNIFVKTSSACVFFYVYSVQIITALIAGVLKMHPAFVLYYVIFFSLLLYTGYLVTSRYGNIVAKYFYIPYSLFTGYMLSRYTLPEYLQYVPAVFVVGLVSYIILIFGLFYTLFKIITDHRSGRTRLHLTALKNSAGLRVIAVVYIVSFVLLAFGYYGYGAEIRLNDSDRTDMRISFYGLPFGALNTSLYADELIHDEFDMYRKLNSTFFIPINLNSINNNSTRETYTYIFRQMEKYGIPFVLDTVPINKEEGRGDFVTYWYTEEVNETVKAVISWMKEENLTNFKGIELDVEGPIFDQPISVEMYRKGIVSFNNIFAYLKHEIPGSKTYLVSIPAMLFDVYDGDRDLDIMQKTISCSQLDVDGYGFMTYYVGDYWDSYLFYYYNTLSLDQFGSKAVFWIGWFSDYDSLSDPSIYSSMITQLKIAKAMGAKETVLAPSRYFLGNPMNDYNKTKAVMLERLNDLLKIKSENQGVIVISVHQNMMLVADFPQYIRRLSPAKLMCRYDIFRDLIVELSGGWLMYYLILQSLIVIYIYMDLPKRLKFGKTSSS